MPHVPFSLAGTIHIASAEVPPDVLGLVVHADGFTVVTEGRAVVVTMPPAAAVELAHRLLRGAAKAQGREVTNDGRSQAAAPLA
ncbi:MAG: hypothetical protein EOP04_11510 [Proteobacteria bacterium]|nr:MAG: hypothetical protein EOP04_11510 [Pseudomonadota bacterium]